MRNTKDFLETLKTQKHTSKLLFPTLEKKHRAQESKAMKFPLKQDKLKKDPVLIHFTSINQKYELINL